MKRLAFVGVNDAGVHQVTNVLVGKAVVDHASIASRADEITIAEEP